MRRAGEKAKMQANRLDAGWSYGKQAKAGESNMLQKGQPRRLQPDLQGH